MRRYALRDEQWDRIKDFLPGREGHVGGTAADNRLFVEAVLYRYRASIPWRDLPERFGDWKIVHQRFGRWAKSGVFERIFKLLASDHDNDRCHHCARSSTQRRSTKKNGEQAIGRSRGGLSTKIHALVDALGNPVKLLLTQDRPTTGLTLDVLVAEDAAYQARLHHATAIVHYNRAEVNLDNVSQCAGETGKE